jgi:hypothetical protein
MSEPTGDGSTEILTLIPNPHLQLYADRGPSFPRTDPVLPDHDALFRHCSHSFNTSTVMRYQLPTADEVPLAAYDATQTGCSAGERERGRTGPRCDL